MTVIKVYADGTELARGSGNFDDWCIFVDGDAPLDQDYFRTLAELAERYGADEVYEDFKKLYTRMTGRFEQSILDELIPEIAAAYAEEDELRVDILFGTLYMVMLAEENRYFGTGERRTRTKLGRKVKGLAIYQILFENFSVEEACNYSKGRNWRELDQLCNERGLQR